MCVWNGSAPRSAIRGTPQMCVCVRLCTRKIKGEHGCIYVCVCRLSSLSRRQLLVCECIYMCANTAERLRLHKAVILLLIMLYVVLKIVYSQTTTPCNLLSSPHKENHSLIESQAQKADAWYNCYKFAV